MERGGGDRRRYYEVLLSLLATVLHWSVGSLAVFATERRIEMETMGRYECAVRWL